MTKEISRRAFCQICGALGVASRIGAPFAVQLAAMNTAAAQTAGDYKALVCIFLAGGNDGHNTVLATDSDSWGRYWTARNTGSSPIALMPVGTPPAAVGSVSPVTGRTVARQSPEAFGGVLPIVPKTANPVPAGTIATTRTFALNPHLAPLVTLFNARRLAIVANIGTLITPTTKAQYAAKSVPLPPNLRSHNDQQSMWQAGAGEGARLGWGGRIADFLFSTNGTNAIFTAISVSGNAVFLAGQNVIQYQISTGNKPATVITGTVGPNLFTSNTAASRLRSIIRDTAGTSLIGNDYSGIVQRSMDTSDTLNAAFATGGPAAIAAAPTFVNPVTGATETNTLASQLQSVAKMIATNATFGMRRQIFYVTLGNFDTHADQNETHHAQMAKLGQALSYFDGVLGNINGTNMRSAVTTFTASDFSRTFTTNGSGTDHAWGSHHFVMGGAVNGGDIYGQYPTLGVDGGSFVNPDGFNNQLVPTISVDQYAGTLAKWFGVTDTQLDIIFPNLRNFSPRALPFV